MAQAPVQAISRHRGSWPFAGDSVATGVTATEAPQHLGIARSRAAGEATKRSRARWQRAEKRAARMAAIA